MTTVSVARPDDIEMLVASVAQLFRDDAGQHDKYADITWPQREGFAHYSALLTDPGCLVLVAREGSEVIGHLVGKLSESTPTRSARFAILESVYVNAASRGAGLGSQFVQYFLTWARERGAVQANVSAYVANDGAQRLYQRHGFAPQSVTLRTSLTETAS
jgi:GNAT superfamily N-acetyltransferase